MKKIFTIILCTAVCLCAANQVHAQKIYKSKAVASYLKHVSSNETQLQRAVHNEFKRSSSVDVIDFADNMTSRRENQTLKPFLKAQSAFNVDNAAGFTGIKNSYPDVLTLIIPFKNEKLTVDLIKSDILTNTFRVITDKNPAGELVEKGAHYRGVVRDSKSIVSISLFDKKVEGLISMENRSNIEITKLLGKNENDAHAVYATEDLLVKSNGQQNCQLLNPPKSELIKTPGKNVAPAANMQTCVTNYWECAYNLYQYFGTTSGVSFFTTALFNTYATIFSDERIGMKLNTVYIWTSADPYADDLNTFSSLRTGFTENLAMLLSSTGGGGVAWLNTLCFTGDYYRHSFCGSILLSTVLPITTYSWPVNVTTHEVGHNLGSPHTHACAWNGNNTAIDGCGPSAGYSEGCTNKLPSTGGTIMSYCHLTSVGVKLTKGFGTQPGDLIRSVVSSCITSTCQPTGNTCRPPSNLRTTNITTGGATLLWAKVAGATYYYVYLSSDNGATFSLVGNYIYGTTFRVSGLSANKNYIFEVWVACASGLNNSASSSFTTAAASVAPGINADGKNAVFSVYPNPVTGGRFTISLLKGYENSTVEILNSWQQVIIASKVKGLQHSFNTSLSKGIYYVRVTNKDEMITGKLLVE
ncbi:T9SS type A sorting domain-containing protein [Panacibacter sp. DH6]|uniref:T9SS type A sorting domain-containing protein n=1 Tax=Panacibacter microcysteis TaxID=2793269 RepID=A0A931E601_9BACT|nr:M12 family metallo-peptidase [Panacibacter microcysteis]MBG9376802.1 T9SS type A sorting domain-containing protein [Panacibacter microcysteis]